MSTISSTTNLWPRPGIALLPKFIRRAWSHTTIPAAILERAKLPNNTTVADLDVTVWSLSGDPDGLKIVANHMQRLVYDAIYFQTDLELARSKIFDVSIPDSLNVSKLSFSTRTKNLVNRTNRLRNSEWLGSVSADQLCAIQGLGSRALLELVTVIESALPDIEMGTSDKSEFRMQEIESQIEALRFKFPIDQISPNDPRLSGLELSGSSITNALRVHFGLDDALGQRRFDLRTGSENVLVRTDSLLTQIENEDVGQALEHIVASCLKSPHTGLVAKRLGWDGNGGCTLQEAADEVGISRERVRQLESRMKKNLEFVSFVPVLDRSIETLESAAMSFEMDASLTLMESGLASRRFFPAGIKSAARFLKGKDGEFTVAPNGKSIVPPGGGIANSVWDALKSLSDVNYISNLSEIQARVAVIESSTPPMAVIRSLVSSNDRVEWLDDTLEWFWLRQKDGRNRWLNITRKLLSVSDPLGLSALRDGLRRPHSNRSTNIPRRILKRLCEVAGLLVHNDQISSRSELNHLEYLNSSEIILFSALEEADGILRREELQEYCLSNGMNRHSFWVYLSYNPLLVRIAPSVYGLRGREIDPAKVAALAGIPQTPKQKVLRDHGWTGDGSIWLGYRLSSNSVESGVVFVPSDVRNVIGISQIELFGMEGNGVGTFVIGDQGNAWGLTPYFDRRGVEAGDALVIIISTELASGIVRSGSHELLSRYELDEGQGVREILEAITLSKEQE